MNDIKKLRVAAAEFLADEHEPKAEDLEGYPKSWPIIRKMIIRPGHKLKLVHHELRMPRCRPVSVEITNDQYREITATDRDGFTLEGGEYVPYNNPLDWFIDDDEYTTLIHDDTRVVTRGGPVVRKEWHWDVH